ncbi:MAG: DsbA family protein [Rhodobacteraceae bacterium]|nr:DsbA family protein [Paracoccaceae bacterium]
MTTMITRRASLALIAGATTSATFARAAENTDPEESTVPTVQEFTLGDENAPIKVVEYSSFTCPHCANFHRDVFPLLETNFINTGKIFFIYRPVYFDGPGLWADMLARCTGDSDKFFEISDILFKRQAEWSRAGSQAAVSDGIISVGKQAGLDEETIVACLQDNDNAQLLVADFQANAERDNIRSTPSFLIDGELTQNMSYEDFAKILNDKLGE